MMFDNVRLVQRDVTRQARCSSPKAPSIPSRPRTSGNWRLGEYYGRSMINDFNDGAVGWTDWNVLLDEKGGPNHVGNFCFAPIHADTRTGELTYTNSYYYIGHFSKFVRPGAEASPARLAEARCFRLPSSIPTARSRSS